METDINGFKHLIKINIRYADLDTFGHINNKAYLSFLEEARIDYHKKVFNWKKDLEFSAVVAKIEINYLKPVFYGDNLFAYTKTSHLGNKSFELSTLFVVKDKKDNNKVVANAKVVLVSIDKNTGLPNLISEEEKKKILEFDK